MASFMTLRLIKLTSAGHWVLTEVMSLEHLQWGHQGGIIIGGWRKTLIRLDELQLEGKERRKPRNGQVNWKLCKRQTIARLVGTRGSVSMLDNSGPFTPMFGKSLKTVRKLKGACCFPNRFSLTMPGGLICTQEPHLDLQGNFLFRQGTSKLFLHKTKTEPKSKGIHRQQKIR